MTIETDLLLSEDDAGKKVYRRKELYTLMLEQDVVASSKDAAHEKLNDQGGISYKDLRDIAVDGIDVETYFVDADYDKTLSFECIGTVNKEGQLESE